LFYQTKKKQIIQITKDKKQYHIKKQREEALVTMTTNNHAT